MNLLTRHPVRLLLWAMILAFSGLILRYGVLPALGNTRGDFANYYTASRLLADGVSLQPAYRGFVWFQKQMDRYGIENQVGGFIPHPPSTALLFLPLAPLPPLTAKRIWIVFNLGLVAFCIVLLRRISGLDTLLVVALFLATGYGLLNNFLFGQHYLLLLATILLGVYLSMKGYPVWAGISLGLLLPVKYVGGVFVLYFLWKRQWKLVVAAGATAAAVVLATLLLSDLQTFRAFLTEVLPRHLRGEIQDPYSVYWQSWNSLFRRLFLREASLNPQPLVDAPLLFYISKNLVFWGSSALALFVLGRVQLPDRQRRLFHLGWIAAAVLLLSPGSATYHFLLLSISAVFFVQILLDRNQSTAAAILAILFLLINLPHFMKLIHLASGWSTPLAYPRLWLLVLFALATLLFFREAIRWRPRRPALSFAMVTLLVGGTTVTGFRGDRHEIDDGARRIEIQDPEFRRHLGLILADPDVGRRRLVFSYCELMADRYAIYSVSAGRWTPAVVANIYDPDLAADDSTLLVETIVDSRPMIGLVRGRHGPPRIVAAGQRPRWHPDGNHFAYVREGKIFMSSITDGGEQPLPATGTCTDLSFSPSGESLAYASRDESGTSLRILDLRSNRDRLLLPSRRSIESPEWSPSGSWLVFSWDVDGNRDIWAINVDTGHRRRLTFHRAVDTEPVWDEVNGRIVFTSDRGRGLGCRTLYALPFPPEWQ